MTTPNLNPTQAAALAKIYAAIVAEVTPNLHLFKEQPPPTIFMAGLWHFGGDETGESYLQTYFIPNNTTTLVALTLGLLTDKLRAHQLPVQLAIAIEPLNNPANVLRITTHNTRDNGIPCDYQDVQRYAISQGFTTLLKYPGPDQTYRCTLLDRFWTNYHKAKD